jgi:ABC-type dipeptide/oligopeptide/nickel transport system permease subunit
MPEPTPPLEVGDQESAPRRPDPRRQREDVGLAGGAQPVDAAPLHEFDVVARTQWRVALSRFLSHRAALISLVVLLLLMIASLLGGRIAPYGFSEITPSKSQPPSLDHLMGTDAIGHDLFSQVLRGAQKSVQVALLVAALSTTIGVLLGSLAGYYRGLVDTIVSRCTDLVLVIPLLPLLLVIASRFQGRDNWVALAILLGVLIWPQIARVVRGVFLSLREKEFVEAARAVGASDARIIFRHILPNAVGPIIVSATLTVAVAILIETALSFLGLGVSPPDTSLGKLVAVGQSAANTRPWLFYFPGAVLLVICLCVNFVGDGLRDAFDPQQRRVRG